MEIPPSSEFRRQVERAQQTAKQDNRPWPREGVGEEREHYSSESFPGLFAGRDFDSYFKTRLDEFHKRGRSFVVLDLASSPSSFISKLTNIDGGVCVGFRDRRNILERFSDRNKKIKMVQGNILNQETWTRINQAMGELGISNQGFGTITLVPGGAGEPDSIGVYFQRVLRPAWRRLSLDNGEMFVEVPNRFLTSTSKKEIEEWLKVLKESGIEFASRMIGFNYPWFSFRLNKNEKSPGKLPLKHKL
jgi:hypothetical protein